MAKYYKQAYILTDPAPAKPPVEPLTALQPMKGARARAVMRGQDSIAALSRRIVCRFGFAGSSGFRVANTNPTNGSQTHPDATTEYVCARTQVELTPGCMYRLYVLAVPSGATQIVDAGSGGYVNDGTFGEVRAEIDWYDAASGSEETETVITIPGSQAEFGAEDGSAGGLFKTLRLLRSNYIVPPDIADPAELARFSRHVTCEIAMKVKGGARVVDATLVEEPFAFAMEADDNADLWTSHVYGTPQPDSPGPGEPYPLQRGSETTPDGDPRRGTWHTMNVAEAQQLRLGPCLVHATAFSEDDADYQTTIDRWSIGNTWTRLPDEVATSTYDEDAGGWSVSAGGYAQSHDTGNDITLRRRTAVIPVICRVYGSKVDTATAATVRFQTSQCSYVDVTVDSTTDGWFQAYGWLEVGQTPEQPRVMQVFALGIGGGDNVEVEAFAVHYGGQWAPRN